MEGQHAGAEKFTGVVSAIREGPRKGEERYAIISDRVLCAGSPVELHLYDEVELEYDIEKGQPRVLSANIRGEDRRDLHLKHLEALTNSLHMKDRLDGLMSAKSSNVKELDALSKKLLGKVGEASAELVRSLVSGAPAIIRFHSDGDGSSGAIALYKAFAKLEERLFIGSPDVRWIANRNISYSMESFYSDSMHFGSYKSAERPLICIVDFGTTSESNDSVGKMGGTFGVVWLDHHPIPEDFHGKSLKNYINPMMFGGSSDMSAGFLACLFAETIMDVDVEMLKEASLISEYSTYANNRNHEAGKYATILDFVTGVKDSTHYLDGRLTPKYLSRLLSDKERRDSVYNYASSLIDEAIKLGIEKSKEYKRRDGVTVNVIDFEHIAKKYSGYLLPGRYSSRLQGSLEAKNSNGNITVVTFRNYISIRLGKRVAEKVRLLDIIEALKRTSGLVDSGGGHHEAASIRVNQDNRASVIRLLLEEFGVKA